jgi:hypothetical protein
MAATREGQIPHLTVDRFAPISTKIRAAIASEAESIAPYRGCASAKIVFE